MPSTNSSENQLLDAIVFAASAHSGQYRKGDGSEYLNHLIEVAKILKTSGHSECDLLVAALLHDVIEDTTFDYGSLNKMFGKNVAELVEGLTDDKELSLQDRRSDQLKRARFACRSHKLIKLADGISNARLVPVTWSMERASSSLGHLKNIAETCEDASPKLAHLLLLTVDESLRGHECFIKKTVNEIERWLHKEQVIYSASTDQFYRLSEGDNGALHKTDLESVCDFYLRSLRKSKLTFTPLKVFENGSENDLKVQVKSSFFQSIKEPENEPVFESCLLVKRKKVS